MDSRKKPSIEVTDIEKRAIRNYWKRKTAKVERIDNSALPAGSPMYYYCHCCGTHTETLPEAHLQRPTTTCSGCAFLMKQQLMPPPTLEEIGDAPPSA